MTVSTPLSPSHKMPVDAPGLLALLEALSDGLKFSQQQQQQQQTGLQSDSLLSQSILLLGHRGLEGREG